MIQIQGLDKLQKTLETLQKKTARSAVAKATRAGNKILLQAVRQAVPVDKGILKKSETSKITTKGLTATGIIGSDQDKLNAEAADHSRPTNIDWLVEYGHVAPDGRFVPPTGYMRRAADGAMPEAMQAYANTLRDAIEGAV